MFLPFVLIVTFSLGMCKEVSNSKNDSKESNMKLDAKYPSIEEALRSIQNDSITADSRQGDLPRKRIKRVVYGNPVSEYDYPFIANIFSRDTFSHKCGGTLISPRLVLTAAHCLKHNLGFIELNQPNKFGFKYYRIKRSIPHPDYQFPRENDARNTVHDIAVLVLEDSVPNAQTVELIPPTHDGEFTTATLYGWGMTENGSESQQLRAATLNIMSLSECEEHYKIVDGRICADGQNGNMGPGDSGGPLMWNGYQIGIASLWMGLHCTDGRPSAYTRISAYRNWIDEQIRSVESSVESEPEADRDQQALFSRMNNGFLRFLLEDIPIAGCSSNHESTM